MGFCCSESYRLKLCPLISYDRVSHPNPQTLLQATEPAINFPPISCEPRMTPPINSREMGNAFSKQQAFDHRLWTNLWNQSKWKKKNTLESGISFLDHRNLHDETVHGDCKATNCPSRRIVSTPATCSQCRNKSSNSRPVGISIDVSTSPALKRKTQHSMSGI